MSAVLENAPPAQAAPAGERFAPCVAFVTPHKATYLKPLYESFAAAQPGPWRTLIIWPAEHHSEHPQELLTPSAPNLQIKRVTSRGFLGGTQLNKALEDAAPSLVVIQEYAAYSLGGLRFARRKKIPVVVVTEVGMANRHFFNLRARLWHSWWSRFVNGIGAACPAAHEPLSRCRLPSVAIYHAVDSRLYSPFPKQKRSDVVFAYLGQLIPRKGLDLWIAAARMLRAGGHENFKLRIIGGGDEAWLRGVIDEAGMADKVEWTGFLSGAALREALGTSDVFVLPTRADTYAAVVHEAACIGLPLLVSRHAGAAEALVRNGENGFVIDPEDTGLFAYRMLLLLDDKLRDRMSDASCATGVEMSAHRRGAALWSWMQQTFALVAR